MQVVGRTLRVLLRFVVSKNLPSHSTATFHRKVKPEKKEIQYRDQGIFVLSNEVFFEDFGDDIDLRMDMELGVDVFQVGIDGEQTDVQTIGDVLLAQAVHQQLRDFLFALGQVMG